MSTTDTAEQTMEEMNDAPLRARRSFLGRCAAAAGMIAASALAPRSLTALSGPPRRATPPDESWLAGLTGKHRQIFEVGVVNSGVGLARVFNFLNAYHEAYGLSDAEVNAIFGAHSAGLALLFGDPVWARYSLGQRLNVLDPLTRAAATRNPFIRKLPQYSWPVDYSVEGLQRRGVRFIGCGTSLGVLAGALAQGGDAAAVEKDLRASLLPGVTIVPSMVVAINRAQESGLTYCAVG